MPVFDPFSRPLYVMAKPAGALCNLRCDYCYYLEKAHMYADNSRHIMTDELLERFIEQYLSSQTMNEVLVVWWNCSDNMPAAAWWTTAYRPTAQCSPMSGADFLPSNIGWWEFRLMGRRNFTMSIAAPRAEARRGAK